MNLRPTYKELANKIKLAVTLFASGAFSILEPGVILNDAMELGYSFEKEFSSIFQELLSLATPENYAGARPPLRSYEAAIKGAELYAFVVQPTLLESVDVYFKFALYNDCLMLVSLHRDRKGDDHGKFTE